MSGSMRSYTVADLTRVSITRRLVCKESGLSGHSGENLAELVRFVRRHKDGSASAERNARAQGRGGCCAAHPSKPRPVYSRRDAEILVFG
jgi:hypothetical protein